jgi:type III secretory pathway component EscV
MKMRYKRFYDKLELFKSNEVSFSDIILAILVLWALSMVIIPVTIIMFSFLLVVILYTLIEALYQKIHK